MSSDAPVIPAELTGFIVGREYERRGVTKNGAKLLMAISGAALPDSRRFAIILTVQGYGRARFRSAFCSHGAGSDFSHGCRSSDASAYGCRGKATGGR
ncbi:hypothetical protein GHK62_01315 [Sinorhizobium terangae]|uniref:Acetyl-coenzyme A carboxylase carboxyl transferase subunit beta domain-containing protein n=1 Tax=Sinorhizobium terangae TaxID=110322 RepID=A0A6N7L8B9_SINTE|nr:hypothetical protein [Sinorhizobium terangae]